MTNNWPIVPLGEVTERIERPEAPKPGVTYRQLGVRLWGVGAYEREPIDGIETRYKTLSRVEAKDIVVNKIWARNGSVAVVSPRLAGCYVSTEFPQFLPDLAQLEPRWFHWLTKTSGFWRQCDEKSHGTSGKNRIRPEKFLEIKIPLPPLDEQRRIVARIEELAAKVERAQSLRQKSVVEVEALLGSTQTKIFSEIKKKKYKLAKLKTKTTKIGSGSTPRGGKSVYIESGVPFIRSQNVLMNDFTTDGLAYISDDIDRRMSNTQVIPGDVLLNITGASIGRACCVPEEICPANVNQHVSIIRPTEELESRFVMYWLSDPRIQAQIMDIQKGATRQALTKKQIENFDVPIPPLPEQRRIVAYLDGLQAKVEAVKRHQAATAAKLEALLPSILDKAFKGEL